MAWQARGLPYHCMSVSFPDLVAQSLATLRAHKLRSALTAFGIAWGIASLLLLGSIGEGILRMQKRGFDKIGENLIQIRPGRVLFGQGTRAGGRMVFFNYGDYEQILSGCPLVARATPIVGRGNIRMSSSTNNGRFGVGGVMPAYFQIAAAPLQSGRLITPADSEERRQVVVIGNEMRRILFAGRPPLGETLYAGGIPFTVIGTLARVGEPRYPVNVTAFFPFRTAQKFFPTPGSPVPDPVNNFLVQPADPARSAETLAQVRRLLERRHDFGPDDRDALLVRDTVEEYRQVQIVARAMTLFLGGVGVVTLALGAIGVMNIMLVSVSERTIEIGIRKAAGATSADILWQFFAESLYLTLGAGALGLGAGWGFNQLLTRLAEPLGFWPPVITWQLGLAGLAVLTVVAFAAGLLPARRAAALAPAEALRAEI